MEVDLLCQESQLVIELDGEQHLRSPDAYRRDRRKDALLQESGYFVLRFLAADVIRQLDQVLDTIHRTLTHLRQPAPRRPPAREWVTSIHPIHSIRRSEG